MSSHFLVNVGCGATPTPGWLNFDNSPTVLAARIPGLPSFLKALGLISAEQLHFAKVAKRQGIRHAKAVCLPLRDCSVDALYSSHMLEHLSRTDAVRFVMEARRVLRPGGILRLSVPDLTKLARDYVDGGDSVRFLERTLLIPDLDGLRQRAKLLILGARNHRWMYDEASLRVLLLGCGFSDLRREPSGNTRIAAPGALDLAERADESLVVEAIRTA